MSTIHFNNNYPTIIQTRSTITQNASKTDTNQSINPSNLDFKSILQQKLNTNTASTGIVFSKHAQQRISERNISISPQLMQKLDDAISKANQKGVKDALILSDDVAFIVNVRGNTVVTTFNNNELKSNIFTNIDGTVII